MKTITEIRSSLSALLASWHARGDYADQETIKAMTDNLKGALKAWEAADGPTQWEASSLSYLERLRDRLANPPAKVETKVSDPRSFLPGKTSRMADMVKQNAAERAWIARQEAEKKRSA